MTYPENDVSTSCAATCHFLLISFNGNISQNSCMSLCMFRLTKGTDKTTARCRTLCAERQGLHHRVGIGTQALHCRVVTGRQANPWQGKGIIWTKQALFHNYTVKWRIGS